MSLVTHALLWKYPGCSWNLGRNETWNDLDSWQGDVPKPSEKEFQDAVEEYKASGEEARRDIMNKLSASDAAIIRGIEDIVDILFAKGETFPVELMNKLDERKTLRAGLL